MYEQLSLFDFDKPKGQDLEAFILCTGSNVVGYEGRVINEYKKNKAISIKWLKDEYGIGGFGKPHEKGKMEVTDISHFDGRVSVRWYDIKDIEHNERYTFKQLATKLTSMLKAGTFKHLTIDQATKLYI